MELTANFSDEDFQTALARALKTVLVLGLVGIPVAWISLGWRSAALFVVGAAIAATGIYEWQRLMGAVLDRLKQGGNPRPLAPVLFWFVLRLLLTGAALYVSLRCLDGSPYALIAGISLAILSLLLESFRLLKVWTP